MTDHERQRQRLMDLILNAPKLEITIGRRSQSKTYQTVQNLVDYLLDSGVTVLPCKLGDKLYDATEFFSDIYHPEIYELQDNVMTIEKGVNGEYIFTYDGMYIYPEEIGKTVFLSREEAERALVERSDDK